MTRHNHFRFYIPFTPTWPEVWIDGKEAHHILHVKRIKPGYTIILFDGKGTEYQARVTQTSNNRLKAVIEEAKPISREAHVDIIVAFSVPKGKYVNLLVQKCTELGVKRLIPIHCERSIVDIRSKFIEKKEKWNKIVIEASKQCKRNLITVIEDVMSFLELMKHVYAYDLPLIACLAPHSRNLKGVLNRYPAAKKILCIIGPEGGFTQKEITLAEEAGCIPIRLGDSTFKIETAAIAMSSMILYAYSESDY